MNTVVTNLKLMNGSGALKAFLDVTFDEHLTIKGFRVVQKEGQEPWVAFLKLLMRKTERLCVKMSWKFHG